MWNLGVSKQENGVNRINEKKGLQHVSKMQSQSQNADTGHLDLQRQAQRLLSPGGVLDLTFRVVRCQLHL